jgi:hypothetical protein
VRVRLLAHFEGAQSWPLGSEQDVEQDDALRLIAAGFAVPVESVKLQTATAKPVREKRG